MGKQQVTMTIDSDVAGEFQRLFPNERSSYCNEMMRLRIASSKGDISGVKLELLLIKEKELKEQTGIMNSELLSISEQIRMFKDQRSKLEQQRLQQEQERIEAMSQCNGCGQQMQESKVEADGEKFCNECWNNQNPKMLEALKRHRAK